MCPLKREQSTRNFPSTQVGLDLWMKFKWDHSDESYWAVILIYFSRLLYCRKKKLNHIVFCFYFFVSRSWVFNRCPKIIDSSSPAAFKPKCQKKKNVNFFKFIFLNL